jgi:hypothetical protein
VRLIAANKTLKASSARGTTRWGDLALAPAIILGSNSTDAMTIALLLALAGSLGLMAFIVKKLEKAV